MFLKINLLSSLKWFFCLVIFGAVIGVIGCSSHSKKREYKKPLQGMHMQKRHGWTVFSGPKRTIVDVNDSSSISRGKKVYMSHCAKCHGKTGAGDGPVAKAKSFKPANLTKMSKAFPNYYLVYQVNEGKGEMPQWKDVLTSQELWDVSNYIQGLKK